MESSLIEPLIGVLGTALTGVLLAIIRHFLTKTKIELTKQQEEILREAIRDAVGYVESWAIQKQSDGKEKPDGKSKLEHAKMRAKGHALKKGLRPYVNLDDDVLENAIERELQDIKRASMVPNGNG